MSRLTISVLACLIGLCWLLAAPAAFARTPDLPYAGDCELSTGKRLIYRGTCAVSRATITAAQTAGRCTGELIALRIPRHGRADLLRGTGPGCGADFLGSPVAFIAEDSAGWLVVSSAAGKVLRFDPGPDPALPVLDDFLAGLDRCTPSERSMRFFQSLAASYTVPADAPEGPVAANGQPVIWPPGGLLDPARVSAVKRGDELHVDVRVTGSYLGLPLSRLHFEFLPDGGWFLEQSLVFEAPRAEVEARFGAALAQTEREIRAETGQKDTAYVAQTEPGTLVCFFAW